MKNHQWMFIRNLLQNGRLSDDGVFPVDVQFTLPEGAKPRLERRVVGAGDALHGGVHGELREPDVHRQDADLPQTDGAQRGAAACVRAVVEHLQRGVSKGKYLFDDGGGEGIRRVRAARVSLDGDAFAEVCPLLRIVLFPVVGVEALRVVEGDAKGRRKGVLFSLPVLLLVTLIWRQFPLYPAR